MNKQIVFRFVWAIAWIFTITFVGLSIRWTDALSHGSDHGEEWGRLNNVLWLALAVCILIPCWFGWQVARAWRQK